MAEPFDNYQPNTPTHTADGHRMSPVERLFRDFLNVGPIRSRGAVKTYSYDDGYLTLAMAVDHEGTHRMSVVRTVVNMPEVLFEFSQRAGAVLDEGTAEAVFDDILAGNLDEYEVAGLASWGRAQ